MSKIQCLLFITLMTARPICAAESAQTQLPDTLKELAYKNSTTLLNQLIANDVWERSLPQMIAAADRGATTWATTCTPLERCHSLMDISLTHGLNVYLVNKTLHFYW